MIIDTHCHYNLDPLFENWSKHWQKAREAGVTQSIVVGTSAETSQRAVEIASQEENLKATVGIHPNQYLRYQELNGIESHPEMESIVETWFEELQQLISSDQGQQQKIVAIGETGLDYFRLNPQQTELKEIQLSIFKKHIELAQKNNLPLILHIRDQETPEMPSPGNAYWDSLDMMRANLKSNTKQNFVLHCISGPKAYLQEMIELGAYVGIAGNITYKKSDHLRDLVSMTPSKKLLLETDAPFLPPQEFRGKTCEPWMITKTAQFVSENLNLKLEDLVSNSHRCFQLLDKANRLQ